MEAMIIQKLERASLDIIHQAQVYYSLLSALNGLSLTEREIQLIAFTAVRGSISYGTVREEFCVKYGSSFPTINNIVSKLKKLSIFVKQGKEIIVNPVIALDFSKDILLGITLTVNNNGETSKHASEGLANQEVRTETIHS